MRSLLEEMLHVKPDQLRSLYRALVWLITASPCASGTQSPVGIHACHVADGWMPILQVIAGSRILQVCFIM